MGRFLDAAEIVLRRARMPLKVRDITDRALDDGLLDFSNGKTPHQTMKAKLSVNIKRLGSQSHFKRAAKGLFTLREFKSKEYTSLPFEKRIRSSEDVMVFSSDLLTKLGWFHGINRAGQSYAPVLLDRKNTRFMTRIDAELNSAYKQAISYVIITKNDSVLRFVRGNYSSAQSFLKGRYCIGFGGHVQSKDFDNMPLFAQEDSGYFRSIVREINEELHLPKGAITDDSLRMIGVLNDDTSFVGKVHFAFIHILDLGHLGTTMNAKTLKKEKSINQLRFVPINELGNEYENYEYWSKLCIKAFFNDRVHINAKVRRIRNHNLRKHPHIAVVGTIGSGKTEACKLLQERFGYESLSSGAILGELAGIGALKNVGRRRFQDLGFDFIRREDGPEELATEIFRRIQISGKHRHVIDGIRNVQTFLLLKHKLEGELSLIFVESTPDDAFEFFRAREDSCISFDDFLELLHHPVEQEIPELLKQSNIVIYNQSGKSSYLEAISHFFAEDLSTRIHIVQAGGIRKPETHSLIITGYNE